MNLFSLDVKEKFELDGEKIEYFYFIEFGEINEVAIYERSVARMNEFYYLMYCGTCIKKGTKEDIFEYYHGIMNNKKRLKFVHLSRDLNMKRKFVPRIPVSRLDDESKDIKRVCVAQNISDVYSGMHGYSREKFDQWGYNQFIMYEIIPDELDIKLENIILNEDVEKHVPDTKHTGEIWITQEFEVPFSKVSGLRIYEAKCETKYYKDNNSNVKWAIDYFNILSFETFNLREFYSNILGDFRKMFCENKNDIVKTYCILSELFNDYYFARNMKVEKSMSYSEKELKEEIVDVIHFLEFLDSVCARRKFNHITIIDSNFKREGGCLDA